MPTEGARVRERWGWAEGCVQVCAFARVPWYMTPHGHRLPPASSWLPLGLLTARPPAHLTTACPSGQRVPLSTGSVVMGWGGGARVSRSMCVCDQVLSDRIRVTCLSMTDLFVLW